MSLREELVRFLRDVDVDLPADAGDDTSLLGSGRVDSLALFQLASWVERTVGQRIDPASVDFATDWETIGDIVRFVERRRAAASAPPGGGR